MRDGPPAADQDAEGMAMSNTRIAAIDPDIQDLPTLCTMPANENGGPLASLCGQLQNEIGELDQVVTAATITATAFRLRDEPALVDGLRMLCEALAQLEKSRAA